MRVVALPVTLSLLFLSGCGSILGLDARSRPELVESYTLIFRAWDANGDGKLSQAEQQRMIESDLSDWPNDGIPPDKDTLRSHWQAELDDADADGDSHLSLAEFLAPILKEFDCLDRDGNQLLDDAELLLSNSCSRGRPVVISPPDAL